MDVTAAYDLHHGDMLEVMPTLEKGSVAMCFADLPYGALSQQFSWDMPIKHQEFWPVLNGLCIAKAAQIFTATMKFAVTLIGSNAKSFAYDLVLEKKLGTNHMAAKHRPLYAHEHILVFCGGRTYNPQMRPEAERSSVRKHQWKAAAGRHCAFYKTALRPGIRMAGQLYPRSVLRGMCEHRRHRLHPTQKPVALLEWLIATYTNPGDTVLDPCFGSNTTGIACARLGRRYIGIEKDAEYFRIGKERLEDEHRRLAEGPAQAALAI